jgi:adenylylsulfate kinase-like enzyme
LFFPDFKIILFTEIIITIEPNNKLLSKRVVEKPLVWGLFKNVQMQGAQKTEPRGVYRYTLSGAVCSVTQQVSVFQQPLRPYFRLYKIPLS